MPESSIAALILAAGSSARFGKNNKLLATANGTNGIYTDGVSVIESVLSNVAGCGFGSIVVAIAPDQPEVETLVHSAGSWSVVNPQAASGMGSSIACGMKRILQHETETFSGVAVYLGDMPSISSDISRRLLEEFERVDRRQIIRPVFSSKTKNTPGHPVIFPADFFPALESLAGDVGAKHLIGAHEERLVEISVTDSGVIRDIDRPSDLSS